MKTPDVTANAVKQAFTKTETATIYCLPTMCQELCQVLYIHSESLTAM